MSDLDKQLEHKKSLLAEVENNIVIYERILTKRAGGSIEDEIRFEKWKQHRESLQKEISDLQVLLDTVSPNVKAQLENVLSESVNDLTEESEALSIKISAKLLYNQLSSGILHLYERDKTPLIEYTLVNGLNFTVGAIISVKIEDFTYDWYDTIEIESMQTSLFYQFPTPIIDNLSQINEFRKVVLQVVIVIVTNDIATLAFRRSFEIEVLARNVIRWALPTANGNYVSMLDHIAAWVTPHHESVRNYLHLVTNKHPDKRLVGYKGEPNAQIIRSQVRAIFESLDEYGMHYVDSTFSIDNSGESLTQTVRLPSESLSEKVINCLDGAVLVASVLEAIDLDPIIVLLTGHAIVGWRTWSNKEEFDFLDTTFIGKASFDESLTHGTDQYKELIQNGHFNREVFDSTGFARVLDIKKLHQQGIHPME